MSDKELLELAAKAAGVELTFENGGTPQRIEMFRGHLPNYEDWNPLTDDGDALRLAVMLNMQVDIDDAKQQTHIMGRALCSQDHKDDKYSATRRAIVRAAAEIGRGMK